MVTQHIASNKSPVHANQSSSLTTLTSITDLESTDQVSRDMLSWCRQHTGIVVMESGLILTVDVNADRVQACKAAMIDHGFRPRRVIQATQALITTLLETDQLSSSAQSHNRLLELNKQQKYLRSIVQDAVDEGVCYVHLEVREEMATVRFRKYGELYFHTEWFPKIAREVALAVFNQESEQALHYFNPSVPQQRSIVLDINEQALPLTIASVPTQGGFDVTIHIEVTALVNTKFPAWTELGYTADQITIMSRTSQLIHGAVIIAGSTGLSSAYTLAHCLANISSTCKVFTIGDQIGRLVDNVTPILIDNDKETDCINDVVQTTLHMDPDVLALGDINNNETAALMIRAAMSDQVVYGKMHAYSAFNIVTRLANLGIAYPLLAEEGLLACLIYQRPLATLCQQCCVPITTSAAHAEQLPRWQAYFGNAMANLRVRNLEPCERCQGLGVAGERIIAEVLWLDEQAREFIRQGDIYHWQKQLKQQGWRDQRDHAIDLILQGLVDPIDAEKIVGEISND